MKFFSKARELLSAQKGSNGRRLPGELIEVLEARIAPATLVSGTELTFQDKYGDAVTVTISKPLLTPGNVGKVFTFDTGTVNGSNTMPQQLELLNITKLGHAAKGLDITITAQPVNSSPGVVNVGYINASGIDLGNVMVGGDLGRINAGDLVLKTPALKSLTVESLGAQGVATQLPGGTLTSNILGPVGSITVNGDIDGAAIGIGGGVHGLLGTLTVTGNINGGTAMFSGSVRTQGGITNVMIDGSIFGGAGASSGLIGTSRALGTVVVEGSVNGGGGSFSGAILATKGIQSVTIDRNLVGGNGANSGQVGTASTLGTVLVEGSVVGGAGPTSGTILATGNIGTATVNGDLIGGGGQGSGQIGSGANIGTITIGTPNTEGVTINESFYQEGIVGGMGASSGSIYASGTIGTVTVNGIIESGVSDDDVVSMMSHAALTVMGPSGEPASVAAGGNIQSIDVTNGTFEAFIYSGGSLGAFTSGNSIDDTIIQAQQNIQGITTAAESGVDYSGVDAGGNIGPVNIGAEIYGSVFVAGIDLGSAFNTGGAGTFSNSANFGFGSSKSVVAAHIGNINATEIDYSTFLAGVHGAGPDGMFGTKDDSVPVGSSIGTINSTGSLYSDWFESGNIGATMVAAMVNTTYLATDTAVSAGGIGPITIGSEENVPAIMVQSIASGQLQMAEHTAGIGVLTDNSAYAGIVGIYNSTFISNAGIGAVNVTISGSRSGGVNGGIASSTFQAGHAIGAITITDNETGTGGTNYGISNTTFNAGLNGYGGVGDISVTLTDSGPDGNSAAIANSFFDASVCPCMGANFGSISAENADTASTAAGILDSVFRVHGNIGPISATMDSGSPSAPAIEGTTFSAFGSIGDINVYGAVVGDSNGPSRFLAGYDIGPDMTFGNEDLSATSLALNARQSIGNVTVTGYFMGSDIAASVNPGAGYVFGSDNNTNIGAGGSVGLVNLVTQLNSDGTPFVAAHATDHAIEAANFALGDSESPTVSAYNYTRTIPVVLYVDGSSGDVLITNLAPAVDA